MLADLQAACSCSPPNTMQPYWPYGPQSLLLPERKFLPCPPPPLTPHLSVPPSQV